MYFSSTLTGAGLAFDAILPAGYSGIWDKADQSPHQTHDQPVSVKPPSSVPLISDHFLVNNINHLR